MSALVERINEANHKVVETIMDAEPVLVDIQNALEVIPGMRENMVLHSGPPVSWHEMSAPQKNGVIGAVIHEKLAKTKSEAEKLIKNGDVIIDSCHEHATVGSMAGITSPSMPVFVVENIQHGNKAYHQVFFDGPGRQSSRLTMGVYNDEVEAALNWRRDFLAPALRIAIHVAEGINLKKIIAESLNMGDECHNRCMAATYNFAMEMAPLMLDNGVDPKVVSHYIKSSKENAQFFLDLVMAACKSMADSAHGIEYSTIVTCIARNGTEIGIKISGLGNHWYKAPSPPIEGLYFSSKTKPEDACNDMGDSTITETNGLGGFVIANSPAFIPMVGSTIKDAIAYTRQMYEITITKNRNFLLPYFDFEGAPLGIDIRKVVEKGIVPFCDTGIAGKEGGFIGIGISRPPMEMFKNALKDFSKRYAV